MDVGERETKSRHSLKRRIHCCPLALCVVLILLQSRYWGGRSAFVVDLFKFKSINVEFSFWAKDAATGGIVCEVALSSKF